MCSTDVCMYVLYACVCVCACVCACVRVCLSVPSLDTRFIVHNDAFVAASSATTATAAAAPKSVPDSDLTDMGSQSLKKRKHAHAIAMEIPVV